MRYLYLLAVLFCEFLLFKLLVLLDSATYLVPIFTLILIAGALLIAVNNSQSKFIKDLGWGMIGAGSIGVFLVVGFFIWVAFNFSK